MYNAEGLRYLEALGLSLVEIPGDGNCLFRSLGHSISGNSNIHAKIRADVVRTIRVDKAYYMGFLGIEAEEVSENRAYNEYLAEKAMLETWGDNLEIQAFARCYDVNVFIFQLDGRDSLHLARDDMIQRRTVYIAYHGVRYPHYSSIRNINGPFVGKPRVNVDAFNKERTAIENARKLAIEERDIEKIKDKLGDAAKNRDGTIIVRRIRKECDGLVQKAIRKVRDDRYNICSKHRRARRTAAERTAKRQDLKRKAGNGRGL